MAECEKCGEGVAVFRTYTGVPEMIDWQRPLGDVCRDCLQEMCLASYQQRGPSVRYSPIQSRFYGATTETGVLFPRQ